MNNPYPFAVEASLVRTYQQNGFVRTPLPFGTDELAGHARAVDAEVEQRTAHDRRSVADKSTYEQSFVQCMRLWETSAAVRALTCHAALAGMASQLMQTSGVRLWQDQALYKEAGGRETTPHQDQTFWPIGKAPLISAWIPFDDVTFANGAMAYVPGSHRAGGLKVVDITHSTTPYDILEDPALLGRQPEWVDAPVGCVVWHNGFTVHQASANTTDHARRVFTIVYIADGYRRIKPWPAFPLDRAGVKVGELMRGDGLPQLWPATGEMPQPPRQLGEPVGPQMRV